MSLPAKKALPVPVLFLCIVFLADKIFMGECCNGMTMTIEAHYGTITDPSDRQRTDRFRFFAITFAFARFLAHDHSKKDLLDDNAQSADCMAFLGIVYSARLKGKD